MLLRVTLRGRPVNPTFGQENNSAATPRVCAYSVAQLRPTLQPHGLQPARPLVHGILQARILEWVAVSSSRGPSPPRGRTGVSYVSCTGRQALYH